MAYAVWPGAPWISYRYHDELIVVQVKNDGPGRRRDVAVEDLARRMYALPEQLSNADRQTIDTFLRARGWTRDPFLFEDPKDAARTAVALTGAVNGSNTVFALTVTETDEEFRHFPKQGSVVLKVDGAAVGVASVDTDARTITASVAPASGVVTADFTGLRLVSLVAAPEFAGQTVDWFAYDVQLEEIIREA